jgi:hypothetical protein
MVLSTLGDDVIRTGVEIAAAASLVGLLVYVGWRMRRRSWSVSRRDEAMRRHISQHY